MTYDDLVQELKTAPITYIPALLAELLERAKAEPVFKPGGLTAFVLKRIGDDPRSDPAPAPAAATEHSIEALRARIKPEGPWFDVPAGAREDECRSCAAGIYWILTAARRRMPVDCYVPGGSAPTATEKGRGVAHFATCPNAAMHRKAR